MTPNNLHLHASFRDPSGFLFNQGGKLYRQVNQAYQKDYDLLMSSGLYERLVMKKMLVSHQETDMDSPLPGLVYRILEPEKIEFISYPYEWSFSQLKDAALLTLSIQKQALAAGMTLKDASAYNIQFQGGRPVLIDTLSFEVYEEDKPWTAYRQFCQHFLAPLALMAYTDVRLNQLMRVYIDGIPLNLASRLLPMRTRPNLSLLTHIHLHARAQARYSDKDSAPLVTTHKFSHMAFNGLIESLQNTIRKLTWKPGGSEWADYYGDTNYTTDAFEAKASIVKSYLEIVQPGQVWDLGANTGIFSRLSAGMGILTISSDIDPAAVEKNYLEVRQKKESRLLPLVLDLTNPSPGIGWNNRERDSFFERGPVDMVLALALVHHLAISNNVPLVDLALFFKGLGKWLVIEFVPKEDSQVQRLLRTRKDIFSDYHETGFEEAFSTCFSIREKRALAGSKRVVYLMESNQ